MLPKLLHLFIIPIFLISCGTNENAALKKQVDSLQVALEKSHHASRVLADIGVMLDSIDENRQLLRVNLVEGTPYKDYSARMVNINNYIERSQQKINDLEQSLKSSKANAAGFSKAISRLKADLANKGREIAFLHEQVEKYRNENVNLIVTMDLQDAEIADKQSQIESRSQELALIEARVQELMIHSKVSDADAYYLRAQAVEIAADRTKLAPRKKKETMREAVELYKKALSLGKQEAQAKIAELERRL